MLEPKSASATQQHSHHYRPDIDGLRAIAVLAVVVFHAQPRLLRGGFTGVDVFFVISGYLITGIILERQQMGRFTIRDFYARRIRRIFPALAVVMLAALAAGWLFLLPTEYADLGKDTAGGAGFISNIVLWKSTNYFAPDVDSKVLLHLWSLGIEEQYYLVWPLLIVFLWRTRWRLIPIATLLVSSFALNVYYAYHDPQAAFYSPLARLWELLLGSVIAYLTVAHGEPLTLVARRAGGVASEAVLRETASVLGLAFILLGFALINERSHFPGAWALLPTVGTALLILAGSSTMIGRYVLSNRAMVAIGLISYPLYLWHWPALVYLRLQFPDIAFVAKLATLAGVFAASWLTYATVERRVRRSRSPRMIIALCAAMAILLVAGLRIQAARGVPNRGDEVHRRIYQAALPPAPSRVGGRRCFIQGGQHATDFSPDCGPAHLDSTAKTVLLWGDSYANHLISAIPRSRPDILFGRFTAAGCPPVFGPGLEARPLHCREAVAYVLRWIAANHPDAVILAANWRGYPEYRNVDSTITRLSALGVHEIVVLGSFAQFTDDVPRQLLRATRYGTVPARLPAANYRSLVEVDSVIRDISRRDGAQFSSPLAVQCAIGSCIAALDTGAHDVVITDRGHLTGTGAKWLVPRLLGGLLHLESH